MNTEKTLNQSVLEYILNNPGKKTSEIAGYFEVEKSIINHCLYDNLKSLIAQDDKYCWYGLETFSANKEKIVQKTTKLSSLCQYYLTCLAQDDEGEVSISTNRYEDYVDLKYFPKNGEIENSDEVKSLISKVRTDKSRLEMYFGYPTYLGKNNKGELFIEPIFLYSLENRDGILIMTQNYPILNRAVLRKFTNLESDQITEELVQLEKELGLNNEPVEIDELAYRLRDIRSEWPWRDKINPENLNHGPFLKELLSEGIYNKGVIIMKERSQYTQGLESELKLLSSLPCEEFKNTALGGWLNENVESDKIVDELLLEVLPLNSEQKQAVQKSLSSNLTVITGPPGTGKSQVVTDLLINAAWKRRRVLFASKNNKAVDVVESRVNNLSEKKVMLRFGATEYLSRLSEYLLSLISSSSTISKDDRENFHSLEKEYRMLENRIIELNKEEDEFVQLRNEVDQLDIIIQELRNEFSSQVLFILRTLNDSFFINEIEKLKRLLELADKRKQDLITKLLWWAFKSKRIRELQINLNKLKHLLISLEINIINNDNISYGYLVLEKLKFYFLHSQKIRKYYISLKTLQSHKCLEMILKEKNEISKMMAIIAENVWKGWLMNRTSNISVSDRRLLNRHKAMLKIVLETKGGIFSSQGGGRKYKDYFNLANQVSHLLPIWAVTSLSAKGKIPFIPGFFDIVIFDEASQCDIASALPLLFRAKQAVVIGDPKQLSHISGIKKAQDQKLLERFNLIPSLVNWAYSYNSLFDLASGFVNASNIIFLKDHHRSHADIIEFSNEEFYGGDLRIATNYNNLKLVDVNSGGVKWVDINGEVVKPVNGGAENIIEARKVIEELKELVIHKNYLGTIGIVTPFRAQANLIRRLVNDNIELSEKLINNEFLIDTVHKFQGDERDVIIFSAVVSNNMPKGALNFLRNNGNLFNVAITRARALLLVVGDLSVIENCEVDYLKRFAEYSQELFAKGEKTSQDKNIDYGRYYPVVSEPEKVSEWEHVFYEALYKGGIRLIPQYNEEKYILDFALFKGEKKLNIEIDGERYHKNWTGESCRSDQLRNQRIMELGWDIKRFWVYEVRDDIENCIQVIKEWLNNN